MVHYHAFWEPKAGNRRAEYEDAYWPRALGRKRGAERHRFAVADGATEAAFSGMWAVQLVRAYVRGSLHELTLEEDLTPLREAWTARLSGRELPWYTAEKVRQGAHATLLGFTLQVEGDLRWEAMAVGDSCLYQVRQGEVLDGFPITDPAAFDYHPALIGTGRSRLDGSRGPLVHRGVWQPGDAFYLMTDALAQWFLSTVSEGWMLPRLASIDGPREFARLVAEGRGQPPQLRPVLHNDDTTLLRIVTEAGTTPT